MAGFHGKAIFVLGSPGNWPEVARIITIKRNGGESAKGFLKRCQRDGEKLTQQRIALTNQHHTAMMEVDFCDDQPMLAKITLTPINN